MLFGCLDRRRLPLGFICEACCFAPLQGEFLSLKLQLFALLQISKNQPQKRHWSRDARGDITPMIGL